MPAIVPRPFALRAGAWRAAGRASLATGGASLRTAGAAVAFSPTLKLDTLVSMVCDCCSSVLADAAVKSAILFRSSRGLTLSADTVFRPSLATLAEYQPSPPTVMKATNKKENEIRSFALIVFMLSSEDSHRRLVVTSEKT